MRLQEKPMKWYNNQVDTTYPARDVKTVSENPKTPQIDAIKTTSQTALTGVCVR